MINTQANTAKDDKEPTMLEARMAQLDGVAKMLMVDTRGRLDAGEEMAVKELAGQHRVRLAHYVSKENVQIASWRINSFLGSVYGYESHACEKPVTAVNIDNYESRACTRPNKIMLLGDEFPERGRGLNC